MMMTTGETLLNKEESHGGFKDSSIHRSLPSLLADQLSNERLRQTAVPPSLPMHRPVEIGPFQKNNPFYRSFHDIRKMGKYDGVVGPQGSAIDTKRVVSVVNVHAQVSHSKKVTPILKRGNPWNRTKGLAKPHVPPKPLSCKRLLSDDLKDPRKDRPFRDLIFNSSSDRDRVLTSKVTSSLEDVNDLTFGVNSPQNILQIYDYSRENFRKIQSKLKVSKSSKKNSAKDICIPASGPLAEKELGDNRTNLGVPCRGIKDLSVPPVFLRSHSQPDFCLNYSFSAIKPSSNKQNENSIIPLKDNEQNLSTPYLQSSQKSSVNNERTIDSVMRSGVNTTDSIKMQNKTYNEMEDLNVNYNGSDTSSKKLYSQQHDIANNVKAENIKNSNLHNNSGTLCFGNSKCYEIESPRAPLTRWSSYQSPSYPRDPYLKDSNRSSQDIDKSGHVLELGNRAKDDNLPSEAINKWCSIVSHRNLEKDESILERINSTDLVNSTESAPDICGGPYKENCIECIRGKTAVNCFLCEEKACHVTSNGKHYLKDRDPNSQGPSAINCGQNVDLLNGPSNKIYQVSNKAADKIVLGEEANNFDRIFRVSDSSSSDYLGHPSDRKWSKNSSSSAVAPCHSLSSSCNFEHEDNDLDNQHRNLQKVHSCSNITDNNHCERKVDTESSLKLHQSPKDDCSIEENCDNNNHDCYLRSCSHKATFATDSSFDDNRYLLLSSSVVVDDDMTTLMDDNDFDNGKKHHSGSQHMSSSNDRLQQKELDRDKLKSNDTSLNNWSDSSSHIVLSDALINSESDRLQTTVPTTTPSRPNKGETSFAADHCSSLIGFSVKQSPSFLPTSTKSTEEEQLVTTATSSHANLCTTSSISNVEHLHQNENIFLSAVESDAAVNCPNSIAAGNICNDSSREDMTFSAAGTTAMLCRSHVRTSEPVHLSPRPQQLVVKCALTVSSTESLERRKKIPPQKINEAPQYFLEKFLQKCSGKRKSDGSREGLENFLHSEDTEESYEYLHRNEKFRGRKLTRQRPVKVRRPLSKSDRNLEELPCETSAVIFLGNNVSKTSDKTENFPNEAQTIVAHKAIINDCEYLDMNNISCTNETSILDTSDDSVTDPQVYKKSKKNMTQELSRKKQLAKEMQQFSEVISKKIKKIYCINEEMDIDEFSSSSLSLNLESYSSLSPVRSFLQDIANTVCPEDLPEYMESSSLIDLCCDR